MHSCVCCSSGSKGKAITKVSAILSAPVSDTWRCWVFLARLAGKPSVQSEVKGVPKLTKVVGTQPILSSERHPTLADKKHSLLADWDHARNAALGMFPDNITPGSAKKVFWLCFNCPAGQEHSYSAPPYSRAGRCPSGCPICAGMQACKCNSLRTHYPRLASEWDSAKNEGTPDDHTAHSTYMAWWTSPKYKSWRQSTVQRALLSEHQKRRRLIKQHGL